MKEPSTERAHAFSITIKKKRNEKKWTQEELARRAKIDIKTVSRAENGHSLSNKTIIALAEVLAIEDKLLPNKLGHTTTDNIKNLIGDWKEYYFTSSKKDGLHLRSETWMIRDQGKRSLSVCIENEDLTAFYTGNISQGGRDIYRAVLTSKTGENVMCLLKIPVHEPHVMIGYWLGHNLDDCLTCGPTILLSQNDKRSFGLSCEEIIAKLKQSTVLFSGHQNEPAVMSLYPNFQDEEYIFQNFEKTFKITIIVPTVDLGKLLQAIQKIDFIEKEGNKNILWWTEEIEGLPSFKKATPTIDEVTILSETNFAKIEFSIPHDVTILQKILEKDIIPNHSWEESIIHVTESLSFSPPHSPDRHQQDRSKKE